MPATVYRPKELGNQQTNYLRVSRFWPTKKEAAASVEAQAPGAVAVEGPATSLEPELALPALSELAGYEVKPPLSCGCASISSCPHRGDDRGFGLVPQRRRAPVIA